jgi:hypothetical protein
MKSPLIIIILAILLIIPTVCTQVRYPVQELGNCASQQDCEKYCDNIQNSESCINFAEKSGMMTKDEVAEARKIITYLKAGETPGKCSSEKTCDEYCNKDENLQECISFAEKAGLIPGEEIAIVKKTGGKGPGGCKGKKQCDDYCNIEANFPTCVDFAVQNGLMDASEAEIVKKTGGKGPGGCKSKGECDDYCNIEANFPTCVDFAVQNGLMDASEAEIVKKTGGKGPGGCKSKQECDNYCKDNQLECLKWGTENGMNSDMGDESKCITKCMVRLNVVCEQNDQKNECKQCYEECKQYRTKHCMDINDYEQKMKECNSQDMNLNPVIGDNGYGRECTVSLDCVKREMPSNYSEEKSCEDCMSKCESREGQVVTGTDCINNECECYYEDKSIFNPPEETSGGGNGDIMLDHSGESTGYHYGDNSGAGPGPGSEVGGSAGETGGSSGESSSSGSSSSDSREGQVAGTGAVIMKVNPNSDGVITKLIEYVRNLF